MQGTLRMRRVMTGPEGIRCMSHFTLPVLFVSRFVYQNYSCMHATWVRTHSGVWRSTVPMNRVMICPTWCQRGRNHLLRRPGASVGSIPAMLRVRNNLGHPQEISMTLLFHAIIYQGPEVCAKEMARRFHTDNALQTRCPARMLTYRYLPGRYTSAVVAIQKYAWVTIAKTVSARRTRTWTRKKAQGQTAREELGRKGFVAHQSRASQQAEELAPLRFSRLDP